MLKITLIPALQDNYIWAIHGQSDTVVIVDPGEAEPVFSFLKQTGLRLTAILCTHRHHDHVDGIEEVRGVYNVPVYGRSHPNNPHITHPLQEGDKLLLEDIPVEFEIWELPGHLVDHIAFVAPGAVFSGDILFGAGCGKNFEGTPGQLCHSLQRLAGLPDETLVYCAHEYTEYTLRFAVHSEPDNTEIRQRVAATQALRAAGRSTVPFTIALEKATNPFLRIDRPGLTEKLQAYGLADNSPASIFAALLRWHDDFRLPRKPF
ncbi:MAG: hydroxyacylglutathione hydrolase [Sideroxydans sp.]|nr:hydroxyacylglutathione hydrolase [Sideroxydans sp.]